MSTKLEQNLNKKGKKSPIQKGKKVQIAGEKGNKEVDKIPNRQRNKSPNRIWIKVCDLTKKKTTM